MLANDNANGYVETSTSRKNMQNNTFKESTTSSFLIRFIRSTQFGLLVALGVIMTFTTILNPRFLTLYNLQTVSQQWAVFGILSIGEILVIVIGGGAIDLSLGSMTALSGVLVALLMVNYHVPVFLAIPIVLTICAGWGLWHGLAFTKLRVPPFITTLATLAIARGMASVITHGWPIINVPNSFIYIGQGIILGIPIPVLMCFAIGAVAAFFFYFTIYGTYFKAIGGNVKASRLLGINVVLYRTVPFVISDLLAGVVGIIIAARLSQGQPAVGQSYELYAIAAAVMGGTALTGGIGSIWGGLIGAGIIAVIWNTLVMLGVSVFWQDVALGFVILLAVMFDILRKKKVEV